MKSHLVTCIYDGLHGSRIGGQLNRGKRYKQSLATIARTGVNITCYTSPQELVGLKAHFNGELQIGNIELLPYDLYTTPFHKPVDAIRDSNNERYRVTMEWAHRCVEVMWSKFIFIKDVLNHHRDLEYIYWIDAGLSHSGIIHSRFNPHYDDNFNFAVDLDKSKNHLTPKNDLIFTDSFVPDLIRYTGPNDILNIVSSGNQHIRIPAESGTYKGSVIGGLFGGNTTIVDKYCDKIIELFNLYTDKGELYKEEQLMTKVLTEGLFPTTLFTFDTWYHPDWDASYYNPNLRDFCDFFDEIKK